MEDVGKPGQLRVWWSPRIGINAFRWNVESPEEALKFLRAFRAYDFYLRDNAQMKWPDNIPGGLEQYDPEMIETLDDGRVLSGWTEWYSEDGEDIHQWGKIESHEGP